MGFSQRSCTNNVITIVHLHIPSYCYYHTVVLITSNVNQAETHQTQQRQYTIIILLN